jgi:hypothetical protein
MMPSRSRISKSNEERSGQSGDHRLADTTIHADPLVEPPAECRIRLNGEIVHERALYPCATSFANSAN